MHGGSISAPGARRSSRTAPRSCTCPNTPRMGGSRRRARRDASLFLNRRGPLRPDWLSPLRSHFAARAAAFAILARLAEGGHAHDRVPAGTVADGREPRAVAGGGASQAQARGGVAGRGDSTAARGTIGHPQTASTRLARICSTHARGWIRPGAAWDRGRARRSPHRAECAVPACPAGRFAAAAPPRCRPTSGAGALPRSLRCRARCTTPSGACRS
jgi:hypothetical protein